MEWTQLTRKILELAETVHRWLTALSGLEPERKNRIAGYAEKIADTLARAADALSASENQKNSGKSALKHRRTAIRELGRINGYVATIVTVLDGQLDGRRLAGVKKRLETLDSGALDAPYAGSSKARRLRIEKLYAAEGYFRALADGLRV